MLWQQIAERPFISYNLPEYEFKKEAALRDSLFFNFMAELQIPPGIAIVLDLELYFLHPDGIHAFKTALYLKNNHIVFRDFFSQTVDMYKIFLLGIKFFYKTKAF